MPTRVSAEPARLMLVVCVAAATSAVVTSAFLYYLPFVRPELLPFLQTVSRNGQPLDVPQIAPTDTTSSPADPMVDVVKRAQPAVVAVNVDAVVSKTVLQQLEDADWVDPTAVKTTGNGTYLVDLGGGSGFFATPDGMLVTNRHVVENQYVQAAKAVAYQVTLPDGTEYPATLKAVDPVLDLAYLSVAIDGRTDLPYLLLGDSDALQPGQTVIAIGNALDQFRNSVTAGIVSGLDRRILAGDQGADQEVIEGAIQTDAAINEGNSGGPLLDMRGEVIGVNTAVSDAGQLLGFALPSNVVKRSLESVKQYGRVVRPYLGVRYVMVTDELAKADSLSVGHGALVTAGDTPDQPAVSAGSPAALAGIKDGDVIMSIGGKEITGDQSLASVLDQYDPGQKVALRLDRAGTEVDVTVLLTEYPGDK